MIRYPITARLQKNRERLLNQEIANTFLVQVVRFAQGKNLISDGHFTADGTLIEAWASLKSFKPKQKEADIKRENMRDTSRNPTVNFQSEKRSIETHASTTDPEAMLARKGSGKEAKLSYCGNVVIKSHRPLRCGKSGGCRWQSRTPWIACSIKESPQTKKSSREHWVQTKATIRKTWWHGSGH